MPIEVTCSSCQGMFHAPDTAGGKRAKCPNCGGTILIPGSAAEADGGAETAREAAYDDDFSVAADAGVTPGAEGTRCPSCGESIAASAIKCRFCGEIVDPSMREMIRGAGDGDESGWRRVRSGLAVIYYCTIIIVIASIVAGIGVLLGLAIDQAAANEIPVFSLIALALGGLVLVGAGIGVLVGQVMCLGVPEASGAKGYITGAVICIAVNIGLSVLGTFIPLLGSVGNLVSFVGYVLFILFIKQSASYLGDQSLADSANRFLILVVVAFVGAIVTGVFAVVAQAEAIVVVFVLLTLVVGIVCLVWYLKLIGSLMARIDRRTGR